jgi:hypothetical protein
MIVIIINSNIVVERLTGGSLSAKKPNIVNPIEISKIFKNVDLILFFMMIFILSSFFNPCFVQLL